MNELKLLGQPELRKADGNLDHSFLSGTKRLVLLAYLVLHRPRGLQRRDKILPLLWPEKGQKSGRNTLSNMLYHIRKALGKESLVTRGTEELGVVPEKVQCDALVFEELISDKKMEEAAALYRGELLEGFHISNTSPDLEDWLDRERDFFRDKYWHVLESLAAVAEKNGDLNQAAKWWKKRSRQDPLDSRVARRQIEVLMASGKRSEAMKSAKSHALYLNKELDLDEKEVMAELTAGLEQPGLVTGSSMHVVQAKRSSADKFSIAVLPFEELGSDEQTSNFASGLHNDLLTRLSGVSALTVISRTSVLGYRNSTKNISKIAEELGAGTVVEGSVQRTTNRARINIQLINAEKDSHFWAETYDRKITADNLFDIQSELAIKITKSLQATLTPGEKEMVDDKPTQNLQAYLLYNQGRANQGMRTESGIGKSITYFKEAIALDPGYSNAWAGYAQSIVLLEWYNYQGVDRNLPAADEVIKKALNLNPALGEAYLSRGILYAQQQNGPGAVKALQKSIDLKPSFSEAYNWLGWMKMILGENEQAIIPAERAARLDPLSPYTRVFLAVIYIANKMYEKAYSEAVDARKIQPEYRLSTFVEGLTLFHLGKYTEAKIAFDHTLKSVGEKGTPTNTEVRSCIALVYMQMGDQQKAVQILNKINKQSNFFCIGLINAALGKTEEAFRAFQNVEKWDQLSTTFMRYYFPNVLDPIRKDKRFEDLLREINKSWKTLSGSPSRFS